MKTENANIQKIKEHKSYVLTNGKKPKELYSGVRSLQHRINSPRLKGYSPGFTAGSCDADRPGAGADDEDSVLGLLTAARGKRGLASLTSNEEGEKKGIKRMKLNFPAP